MNNQQLKRFLYGKTVVITGASSGIGHAAAIAFAECGANLVLAARREDVLETVAAECEALGVKTIAVKTDVTNAEDMKHLADTAAAFGNTIDVWINNAGIGCVGEFTETPVSSHQRVIETNLLGYIHGAHAALPYFKRQGYGVLINTNSLGAWIAQPYSVAYAASKFGLRGFSEALRGELIKFPGIYVCDIFPGFIDTPGFQHGANYVGRKIKPIPPVYDARRVAHAMVSLAVRPKEAVNVGASAVFFRIINSLFPTVTQRVLFTLMSSYFKRAKPVPVSDGALFSSDNTDTGIDGGWTSPHNTRNIVITTAALAAGVGVGYYLLRKKGKRKKTVV
ncbi:SDR family oxidoreductase [Segetibacter koreensis]|uniref:SDR family oxidoreductase n=1 Tax=Segetibacter koreensis TaxID=398037 RepID=UPI000361DA65|nr:SDR family oxidoreductase [Segetibacter koreensis]